MSSHRLPLAISIFIDVAQQRQHVFSFHKFTGLNEISLGNKIFANQQGLVIFLVFIQQLIGPASCLESSR